jgi:hypothetical protein
MQTTRMAAFDAPKPTPTAEPARQSAGVAAAQAVTPAKLAPAGSKPGAGAQSPSKPMVSDDTLAAFAAIPFDPERTQELPENAERTQKLPPGADRTQKLDVATTQKMNIGATQPMESAKPQRSTEGDKTLKIPALDPNFKPEETQILDAATAPAPLTEAEKTDAQVTQRLDDSIWRLQEARRILQGLPQKS